ncbi:hypothetical protein WJX74_006562 [Apatococcus lobatus]|uniref:Uncharacterized protein n=1 Tax=Apatococcus lobatus TaxID=904363 RepID=A0AAW1RS96_9CHLO
MFCRRPEYEGQKRNIRRQPGLLQVTFWRLDTPCPQYRNDCQLWRWIANLTVKRLDFHYELAGPAGDGLQMATACWSCNQTNEELLASLLHQEISPGVTYQHVLDAAQAATISEEWISVTSRVLASGLDDPDLAYLVANSYNQAVYQIEQLLGHHRLASCAAKELKAFALSYLLPISRVGASAGYAAQSHASSDGQPTEALLRTRFAEMEGVIEQALQALHANVTHMQTLAAAMDQAAQHGHPKSLAAAVAFVEADRAWTQQQTANKQQSKTDSAKAPTEGQGVALVGAAGDQPMQYFTSRGEVVDPADIVFSVKSNLEQINQTILSAAAAHKSMGRLEVLVWQAAAGQAENEQAEASAEDAAEKFESDLRRSAAAAAALLQEDAAEKAAENKRLAKAAKRRQSCKKTPPPTPCAAANDEINQQPPAGVRPGTAGLPAGSLCLATPATRDSVELLKNSTVSDAGAMPESTFQGFGTGNFDWCPYGKGAPTAAGGQIEAQAIKMSDEVMACQQRFSGTSAIVPVCS